MDLYYAAAIQVDRPCPQDRKGIAANTKRCLELLEQAVVGYKPFHDVRLAVFPEFGLAAPVYPTAEELAEKLAVEVPGEHIEAFQAKARELNCYVQTPSLIEIDPRFPNALFNTTCLVGPEGILSRYRKLNPWIPWEVHTSPHDIPDYPDDPLPVTETEIGRLGVATCYDWLFPEVTREMALKGAEVLIRISAYMDPWGATPPMDWWTVINRARAIENTACVVASNQGAELGNYPPFSWPGGSMIVDYDGRVMSEAPPGPGERIVVGPIHLASLRAERARRQGHAMLAHLRTELYTSQRRPQYPPADASERNVESQERRIEQSKSRLGW